MRPRSGAAAAVADLISIKEWSSSLPPLHLSYLLIAVLTAGFLSYFLVLKIGKIFAEFFTDLPYKEIVMATILFITAMVFLFTGLTGLVVLTVATFIGLLPITWGVRRSQCMGVLLIPIIFYFL